MAKPPKRTAPTLDLESVLPTLREALRRRRVLKASELGKLGVPAAQRSELLARLVSEGAEATKSGVRLPLRQQLVEAVEARGMLPLATLARLLAGATQAEAKAMAETLVREGACQLVVRGKAEVLAVAGARVLDPTELRSLARTTKALAAQADKALKGRALGKTLLRDDVREALLEFVATRSEPGERAVGRSDSRGLAGRVVAAVATGLRVDLGLCYVPDVVRALLDRKSVV
jgi:hypothetical protein